MILMPNLNLCAFFAESLVIKIDSIRRVEAIPDDFNQENFPSVWSVIIYIGNSNNLMLILSYFSMKLLFKVLNKICFLCSRVGQNLCIRCQVAVGDKIHSEESILQFKTRRDQDWHHSSRSFLILFGREDRPLIQRNSPR